MTRESAKKKIKGFPLKLQSIAKEDIENRAYKTIEIVPRFEMEDGYYQMTVNYKIKIDDRYIYGKALSIEEFIRLHNESEKGEVFTITYLDKSGIILEIEEKDDI